MHDVINACGKHPFKIFHKGAMNLLFKTKTFKHGNHK